MDIRIRNDFGRYLSIVYSGTPRQLEQTLEFTPAARSLVLDGRRAPLNGYRELDQRTLATLRDGVPGSGRSIGGNNPGLLADAYLLTEPTSGTTVDAVLKQRNAAREVFGFEAGAALGIDDMLGASVLRPDGRSATQLLPGVTWREGSIEDGFGMEHALRAVRHLNYPEAPFEVVERAARIDRQLVQSFDRVMRNFDRHPGNGLVDTQQGWFYLIDNDGVLVSDAVRQLDSTGVGATTLPDGSTFVPVLPEVVEQWKLLDRPRIARAVADVRRAEAGLESQLPPDALHQVFADADSLIARGGFTVPANAPA